MAQTVKLIIGLAGFCVGLVYSFPVLACLIHLREGVSIGTGQIWIFGLGWTAMVWGLFL